MVKNWALPLLMLLWLNNALADENNHWQLSGYTSIGARLYVEPQQADRESNRANIHLAPEWTWSGESLRWQIQPRIFLEAKGSGRSRFDFEELQFTKRWDNTLLSVGISQLYWGVTESRHLIDVINAPDYALHSAGDIRLPNAMLQFSTPTPLGRLEAVLLPWERDPRFPGSLGRPRTALPISNQVEHPDGTPPAIAARLAWGSNKFDSHVYYFRGLDREVVLDIPSNGPPDHFVASRHLIDQLGFDLQIPWDNWLLKTELLYRDGYSRPFWAGVLGVEYVMNSFAGSIVDVSWLAEYQFDPRPADAPLVAMQHAFFSGVRVALNDYASTEFKLGITRDSRSHDYVWRGEAQHRLAEQWSIEAKLNMFNHATTGMPLSSYRHDSLLEIELKRHF